MAKQYKKSPVIVAMAFTTPLGQGAWAEEVAATVAPVFDADELSHAFEPSATPPLMLALSEREMEETEGAFWQVLLQPMASGAGMGVGMYTGITAYKSWDGTISGSWNNFKNNWSLSDAGWAAAGGAVGGPYSQALFRGVGYTGFVNQVTAPLTVQVPIRSGAVGLGFSAFNVHGAATTNFENRPGNTYMGSNSNSNGNWLTQPTTYNSNTFNSPVANSVFSNTIPLAYDPSRYYSKW